MNAILVNIMEYLYGKYGDYRKIDQEAKLKRKGKRRKKVSRYLR